ncbi:nucleotide disphospho-sugar-binding domain-containing protein [Nonomuraea sp. NPDC052634]|uniref:nucleotide disphospho-sugar-binding domain-containing protein n=1 Tax=Nonomuraea sp. NPDC052634 TaxID=3155813 RepID=UPI00342DE9F0
MLFVTVPWPTHFHAMVPLAWAFRAAGHEVRVASGPALGPAIAEAGLPAVILGSDFAFVPLFRAEAETLYEVDWSAISQEEVAERTMRMLDIFARISDVMLDDLVAFATSWRPDLIVYEPTMVAAPIAATVLGVPKIRHLWGPDITYSADALQGKVIGGMLARYGLTDLKTLGDLTVDPGPLGMQVSVSYDRQPMRYVPYNGPGEMPRWLTEPPRTRRVLVTWGTSMVYLGGAKVFLLPHAVAAVAELGVEVIAAITHDQRELLGELPEGVRVAEQVPLHMLLPGCDAVVQHGGSGTTLTATACGVPQLIVGQSPDQVILASQVAQAGSGLMLIPRGAGPRELKGEIRDMTRRLLEEESFAATADTLRRDLESQPTPGQVVSILETLAKG